MEDLDRQRSAQILSRRYPGKTQCKELNKIWGKYERRPYLCMCEEEGRREFVQEFRARWGFEITEGNG